MKQEKKTRKAGFTPLQAAGAVLSVLGVAMIAYFAYTLLVRPHGMYDGAVPLSQISRFNGTAPNSTAYGRSIYGGGAGRSSSGFYPVVSGILMLLLGITVFKYGGLKAQVAGRK